MKQPKKLTRNQKRYLSSQELNAAEWMLIEETDIQYRIINKNSGEVKILEKYRRKR